MTQSTAERVREMCAKVCDEQATEPECPERAQYCADAIRALDLSALSDEREAVCQDGMCLIAEARGEQCRCTGRCAYREEA